MSMTAATRPRPKGELKLALDRSARTVDANGFLHIAMTNISKATVSPYLGAELMEPGLEPDRVYWLLRDPEELAKAAPTSNNIPLLDEHIPVDPDSYREEDGAQDHTVGSTGTDANFEAPYLRNSLVVHDAEAIKGIESREKVELSAGYAFTLDLTPGTFEGVSFDGVMRDFAFNHVTLVEEGRAGPDVLVADSFPKEGPMKTNKINPKARLVADRLHGYLLAKLAKDKAPKLAEVRALCRNITADRFPKQKDALKGSILAFAKDRLAKDADLADLPELIEAFQDDEDEDDLGMDADPKAKLMKMMDGKFSEDELKTIGDLLDAITAAKEPAPPAVKPDEPAIDEEIPMDKKAMDAAIAQASKASAKQAMDHARALRQAEIEVEPVIGRLSEVPETVDGIYKLALDEMDVDLKGVEPSTYRHIFRAVKDRKVATDALPDLPGTGDNLTDRFGKVATRLVRA